MLINLRTGTRCLGIAALMTGGSLAWAADESPATAGTTTAPEVTVPVKDPAKDPLTTTWNSKTIFANDGLTISLKGYVDAYAFTHDPDQSYTDDYYRRELSKLFNGLPAAAVPAATFAGSRFTGTPNRFYDGLELHDAQLYLEGSYKKAIFGLIFDGARNDTDTEIEAWYVGLKDIPFLGTLRLGEVYATWCVADGPLTDGLATHANSGILSDVLATEYLVGLKAENRWARKDAEGKKTCEFGYELVVGMLSNEFGGMDLKWDVQAGVWTQFGCGDKASVKLGLAGYQHSPNGADQQFFGAASESWNADVTIFKGATILPFQPVADRVTAGCLSASTTCGSLYVGASYQQARTDAPDNNVWYNVNTPITTLGLLAPYYALDWYLFQDTAVSGWELDCAWALTGEMEQHGGGIGAPARNSGAFELVGRYARLDMQDNAVDMYYAGPGPAIFTNNLTANRQEGGKVEQAAIGLNWYVNQALLVGLMAFHTEWETDGVSSYNTRGPNLVSTVAVPQHNTGPVPFTWQPALPPLPMAVAAAQYQGNIKDSYAVDTIYLRTKVTF